MSYAQQTTVSPERSRAEIEQTVKRYHASKWGYGETAELAVIGFEITGCAIRFKLPIPSPSDRRFHERPRKGMRPLKLTELQARRAHEQEVRRLWRALALSVKAKLEAVESGIALLEEEFLANIVTPGGQTVGERFVPELSRAIAAGEAPKLALPGIGESGR